MQADPNRALFQNFCKALSRDRRSYLPRRLLGIGEAHYFGSTASKKMDNRTVNMTSREEPSYFFSTTSLPRFLVLVKNLFAANNCQGLSSVVRPKLFVTRFRIMNFP
jgi:hypothetical protein